MSPEKETKPAVSIRRARSRELEWINVQYRTIGFLESKQTGEWQAIAEVDGVRAGVGRIVHVGSALELGGMFVLPQYRGLRLAPRLIEYLLAHRDPEMPVYCLPFAHLAPLYEAFGFVACDVTDRTIPLELREKHRWCGETYRDRRTLLFVLSRKGEEKTPRA